MTDIENRKKALALLNEVRAERGLPARYGLPLYSNPFSEALCRAIEQHEAFRQEVSDALEEYFGEHLVAEDGGEPLARFLIAKPDPLADVAEELRETYCESGTQWADALRKALAKRGGKIVWEND